jgi:hypothetical protein
MLTCGLSVVLQAIFTADDGREKIVVGGQLSLVPRTPEVLVGGL